MSDKREMLHFTQEDGSDWLADPSRITEIVGDDDGSTVYYLTQGQGGVMSATARRVREQVEHVGGAFSVQKSSRKPDERDEARKASREAKEAGGTPRVASANPGVHAHGGAPNPNRGNTAATGGIDKEGAGLREGDAGPDVPHSDHMPPGAMAASGGGKKKTDKDRGIQK